MTVPPDLALAPLFTFLGGFILFFIGMVRTSEGMQHIAGGSLRVIFSRFVKNRLKSSLFGISTAFLTQSSAATAVLAIGFVNNGIISLVDGIAVVLGSSIGASLILQFAIFNPGWILIPLLVVSIVLRYSVDQTFLRNAGALLFGLSLLMLGLTIMTSSLEPLRQNLLFIQSIGFLQRHLIFGVLCSALFAAVVQNATAVIALIIAFAASGQLPFAESLVLILGANIGACAPTVMASLQGTLASRRVAASQLIVTITSVVIIILLFPYFSQLISFMSPGEADFVVSTVEQSQWYQLHSGEKPFIARYLVNANTLFALFTTLFFLPFLHHIARFTTYFVHGREIINEFGLQFVDSRVLNTPPVALAQARSELRRMAQTARDALYETILYLNDEKGERLGRLTRYENLLDLLQKELTGFLVELSHKSSSFSSAREVSLMMHMVSDFERIGDHCQSLVRLSQRKQQWGVIFSKIAQHEMDILIKETTSFIDYIITAIDSCPENISVEAKNRENSIDVIEEQMRNDHLQRLTTGECAVRPGLIFIDMVQAFEQISDHAYSVAKCLGGDK